jgi:hypothetical protein
MRPRTHNLLWPGALLALLTVSFAAVQGQNQDKEQPAGKPEGMAQKMDGQMGMT